MNQWNDFEIRLIKSGEGLVKTPVCPNPKFAEFNPAAFSKYNYKTDTQKINSYIRSISTGNEDILKKELRSLENINKVNKMDAIGRKMGITGVPFYIFNEKIDPKYLCSMSNFILYELMYQLY